MKKKKKKLGVIDFVWEIRHLEGYPNFEKSVYLT